MDIEDYLKNIVEKVIDNFNPEKIILNYVHFYVPLSVTLSF